MYTRIQTICHTCQLGILIRILNIKICISHPPNWDCTNTNNISRWLGWFFQNAKEAFCYKFTSMVVQQKFEYVKYWLWFIKNYSKRLLVYNTAQFLTVPERSCLSTVALCDQQRSGQHGVDCQGFSTNQTLNHSPLQNCLIH